MTPNLRLTPKQARIAIALGLLGVILVCVIVIMRRIPTEKLYLYDTGVSLANDVVGSQKDGSYLLNTNRNFVRYNPETGETKLLMNDGKLTTISNISWSPDEKRAIFSSTDSAPGGILESLIEDHEMEEITKPLWWIADFTTKTYLPLDTSLINAGWIDDNTFFIIGDPSAGKGFGLYTSKLDNPDLAKVYLNDKLLNAYPTKDGFLVYTVDKGGVITKLSGNKETVLLKGVSREPFVNRQGTAAVALKFPGKADPDDPDFTEDDMFLINIDKGKVTKKIASKQTNSGFWSSKGDEFYFVENKSDDLLKASLTGTSAKLSRIKLETNTGFEPHRVVVSAGGDMIMLNAENRLYYASPVATKTVQPFRPTLITGSEPLKGEGFEVYYYAENNMYGVQILDGDIEVGKQKAFELLRKYGSNPDLLDIVYDHEPRYLE